MNKYFWKNIFFNKNNELRVEDLMHIITAMIIWIILGYYEIVDIPLMISLRTGSN